MAPARSPSCGGDDAHRRPVVRRPGRDRGSARAPGSSSNSPASPRPPPMTTTSGSTMFTRFATPSATHHASSRITARAPASPSRAAAVTCSPRTASGSPPASSTIRADRPGLGGLAAEAAEPRARREPLPAPPPPARADRTARVDDHVAGLAGEAVGAALEPAGGDLSPADPGAEGHEDGFGRPLRRASLVLGPHGAGRVVLDDDRHAEALLELVPEGEVDHAGEVRTDRQHGRHGRRARRCPAPRQDAPPSLATTEAMASTIAGPPRGVGTRSSRSPATASSFVPPTSTPTASGTGVV